MVMITLAAALLGIGIWLWLSPETSRHHANTGKSVHPGQSWRPLPRKPNVANDTEDYATFIRQLAALLRSGMGPAAAFELLAEIWSSGQTRIARDIQTGCGRALAQLHTGGTLQGGLSAHGRAHGASAPGPPRLWRRLAWCFAICEQSGAALAELLDTLAQEQETAADMHRALQAALAGPRATSRLLTYLPGIGLGLGQLLGINPLAVLTTHPVGRVALLCGIALWLANKLWCARMLGTITAKVPS